MNCQKGDLAILVRLHKNPLARYGELVECLELKEENLWHVRFRGRTHSDDGNDYVCSDECLRPIRDPGDDAKDEMVQRLGTPFEKAARDFDRELAGLRDDVARLERLVDEYAKSLTDR